jgi:hypothetical protein
VIARDLHTIALKRNLRVRLRHYLHPRHGLRRGGSAEKAGREKERRSNDE